MRTKLISILMACCVVSLGTAYAQTMDQEMAGLADKIGKALATQGFKNVAAIDFTDIQGQPTELGRFLSDQLTVEIVSTSTVSMVDRANIKHILAEHNLTVEGLVDPANAKKLGEFAGVDTILTGNVTALDDGIVLMVKAISTSSSRIVAAGRIKFPKTSEIQQLLNRGISANPPGSISPATEGGNKSGTSYQDAGAIATKNIGALRVVLKSVLPLNLDGGRSGVRCTFEFINMETQNPVSVAMNAIASYNGLSIGNISRSTLIDDAGGVWHLRNSDVAGMSFVGVGQQVWNGPMYDPAEIVTLLAKRDDLHSDVTSFPMNHDLQWHFIFGSMSEVSPGQSLTVTMSFVKDESQITTGSLPKFFQISSEIVVGIATRGTRKSYSLYNLMFDRVSMLQP